MTKKALQLIIHILEIISLSLGLTLFFLLNALLAPILSFWLLAVDLVYLLAGLALASYIGDFSVPGVKTLLKREYYRVKFKRTGAREKQKEPSTLFAFYLKFLAHLIILFKSAREGYEVIMEEAEEIYNKTALSLKKEKKALSEAVRHKHFFLAHKKRQGRATTALASFASLFVAANIVVALTVVSLYPDVFFSQAASYSWIQTDWTGEATTTVATHDSDQTGWTHYQEADSGLSIGDNVSISPTEQSLTHTTQSDFSGGTHSGTIASSSGSIMLEF